MEAKEYLQQVGIPNIPSVFTKEYQNGIKKTSDALDGFFKHKMQEVLQDIEKILQEEVEGTQEYDSYDEGWEDACDIVGNKILTHLKNKI